MLNLLGQKGFLFRRELEKSGFVMSKGISFANGLSPRPETTSEAIKHRLDESTIWMSRGESF